MDCSDIYKLSFNNRQYPIFNLAEHSYSFTVAAKGIIPFLLAVIVGTIILMILRRLFCIYPILCIDEFV